MPQSPPRHNAAAVKKRREASQRDYNRTKRTGQDFYNSKEWAKARAVFVKQNPLCVDCKAEGITTLLDVVDHIIPVKFGGEKFAETNLQGLCHLHHNRKTVKDEEKFTGVI